MKRVVVTGLGMVTPSGLGKDSFWEVLCTGKSCIGSPKEIECKDNIVAEVDNFHIVDFVDRKIARYMDRSSAFCFVASQLAIEDARLNLEREDRERIGISIGTFSGPVNWLEKQYKKFFNSPHNPVHIFTAITGFFGNIIGSVSIPLGIKGRGWTFLSLDAAGCDAIGYAYECILEGIADIFLAGGSEAPLTPGMFYLFNSVGLLAKSIELVHAASRPFDMLRNGFILGEGSWMLVLEELNHALKRDAYIYAEIKAFSTSSDDNPSKAMKTAIQRAGIRPEEIDYVNAYGISTPQDDKKETMAIKEVLGSAAQKIPVSSIKSMFGHPLGAAGSMQAACCALVIDQGVIPPTINYANPDPECDLDYVANIPRKSDVNIVLQNTFSLTRKNSAIVYSKFLNNKNR
jgi:3-oxoacyl-[acyl-carrier-protein] synthase II